MCTFHIFASSCETRQLLLSEMQLAHESAVPRLQQGFNNNCLSVLHNSLPLALCSCPMAVITVIFQLIGAETGTESKPIQLTRTGAENWLSKRTGIETGIEITSYRIEQE